MISFSSGLTAGIKPTPLVGYSGGHTRFSRSNSVTQLMANQKRLSSMSWIVESNTVYQGKCPIP